MAKIIMKWYHTTHWKIKFHEGYTEKLKSVPRTYPATRQDFKPIALQEGVHLHSDPCQFGAYWEEKWNICCHYGLFH